MHSVSTESEAQGRCQPLSLCTACSVLLIFRGFPALQAQPRLLPQDVSIDLEFGLSVPLGGTLDTVVAVVVAVRRPSSPSLPRWAPRPRVFGRRSSGPPRLLLLGLLLLLLLP